MTALVEIPERVLQMTVGGKPADVRVVFAGDLPVSVKVLFVDGRPASDTRIELPDTLVFGGRTFFRAWCGRQSGKPKTDGYQLAGGQSTMYLPEAWTAFWGDGDWVQPPLVAENPGKLAILRNAQTGGYVAPPWACA